MPAIRMKLLESPLVETLLEVQALGPAVLAEQAEEGVLAPALRDHQWLRFTHGQTLAECLLWEERHLVLPCQVSPDSPVAGPGRAARGLLARLATSDDPGDQHRLPIWIGPERAATAAEALEAARHELLPEEGFDPAEEGVAVIDLSRSPDADFFARLEELARLDDERLRLIVLAPATVGRSWRRLPTGFGAHYLEANTVAEALAYVRQREPAAVAIVADALRLLGPDDTARAVPPALVEWLLAQVPELAGHDLDGFWLLWHALGALLERMPLLGTLAVGLVAESATSLRLRADEPELETLLNCPLLLLKGDEQGDGLGFPSVALRDLCAARALDHDPAGAVRLLDGSPDWVGVAAWLGRAWPEEQIAGVMRTWLNPVHSLVPDGQGRTPEVVAALLAGLGPQSAVWLRDLERLAEWSGRDPVARAGFWAEAGKVVARGGGKIDEATPYTGPVADAEPLPARIERIPAEQVLLIAAYLVGCGALLVGLLVWLYVAGWWGGVWSWLIALPGIGVVALLVLAMVLGVAHGASLIWLGYWRRAVARIWPLVEGRPAHGADVHVVGDQVVGIAERERVTGTGVTVRELVLRRYEYNGRHMVPLSGAEPAVIPRPPTRGRLVRVVPWNFQPHATPGGGTLDWWWLVALDSFGVLWLFHGRRWRRVDTAGAVHDIAPPAEGRLSLRLRNGRETDELPLLADADAALVSLFRWLRWCWVRAGVVLARLTCWFGAPVEAARVLAALPGGTIVCRPEQLYQIEGTAPTDPGFRALWQRLQELPPVRRVVWWPAAHAYLIQLLDGTRRLFRPEESRSPS